MKVIFLNAWHGKLKDSFESFIQSQKNDTDIFCLQEADSAAELVCRNTLRNHKLINLHKFVTKKEEFTQSVFVNKKINIKSSGSVLSKNKKYGLDLYIQFEKDGSEIWLSNIHGTPVPRDKHDNTNRIEQSKLLIEFFNDKKGIKILGGDFNLFPDTKSIKIFGRSGYKDLINLFNVETTRNHFAWDLWPDNRHYFSDYVFVSKGLYVKKFSVPKNEVSDHLPMILEF